MVYFVMALVKYWGIFFCSNDYSGPLCVPIEIETTVTRIILRLFQKTFVEKKGGLKKSHAKNELHESMDIDF